MRPSQPWPVALLEGIEVRPQIAYQGPPAAYARDQMAAHPFFTWWEIRAGQATVTTAKGVYAATRGQWILIPHGMSRRQLLSRDSELSSLNFRCVWPNGRPVLELPMPLVGSARAGFVKPARAVCRIGNRHREDGGTLMREGDLALDRWFEMQSALLAFVVGIIRYACAHGGTVARAISGDARLDQLVEALRQEVRAGPLPYDEWKRRFGLGRAQLDRLARQHLGTSVRALRDAMLVEEIRRELSTGVHSGKELAAKYHFVDAAHFTRWVRGMTGRTPRELRRSAV